MVRNIIQNWFEKQFVPQVTEYLKSQFLPQRAILLIDIAPCHPSSDLVLKLQDGEILAKFVLPNVMSLTQPMDQGVITCMKKHYPSYSGNA